MENKEPFTTKYKGSILGFITGTLYGLLFSAGFFFGDEYDVKEIAYVSLAMLGGTPFCVGMVTAYCTEETYHQNFKTKFFRSALPILGWSFIALIIQWETIVCVVMLLPFYIPLAYLGSIVGLRLRRKFGNRSLSCVVILPLVFVLLEIPINPPTYRGGFANSVIIDAPVEKVWASIASIENITSEELPWTFSHFIGIPKPISSYTGEFISGGVRKIVWEKGVSFDEVITKIVPYEELAYRVEVDQESMKLANLDTHIVVGDEHFDIETGSYRLEKINNSTKLTLSTNYRMTTNLNWYGRIWANIVLNDLHTSILKVIKKRNESHN